MLHDAPMTQAASNAAYPLSYLQAQAELNWIIGSPTDAEIEARSDAEWAAMDDAVFNWLHLVSPNDPNPSLTITIKWAAFTDWVSSDLQPDPMLASCTACGADFAKWRMASSGLCRSCLEARLIRAFPQINHERKPSNAEL